VGAASRRPSQVKKPKKKARPRARFVFPDGTHQDLELVALEKARLDQFVRMVSSDDSRLQELGDAKLWDVAERLVNETRGALSRQKATAAAAPKRRALGALKVERVKHAIARGNDPPASQRHVRRLKSKL
jgi:hypothetical protein